jgi:hypothetical protein
MCVSEFSSVVAQYFIVEYGGQFVRTTHLNQEQWIKCILLGSLSLPVGGLMRLLPVSESGKDFAVLSDLIKTNQQKSTKHAGSVSGASEKSLFSASGLLWLVAVTVLPLIAYQHFEEFWAEPLYFIIEPLRRVVGMLVPK